MKTSVRKTDTIITVLLSLAIAGAAILSYAFVRVRAQETSQPQASAIGRGEIVFAKRSNGSDYNLFSVSPDGTGGCSPGNAISVCPIVQGPISNEQTPALSPDGNKLAYAAQPPFDSAGKLQLHILDLTTGNDTQLTSNSDDNAYPAWSPDGTRIAFMRGNLPLSDLLFATSTSQIWIVPAAGGTPTQFTANGTNHVTPAWSTKSGQNVLVFARKSTSSGKYFLEQAVVNNDNSMGALKAFTNLSPNSTSDGNNLFPAWSPDGNRIAFTSDRINLGDAIGDIWILDAAAATGSTDAPVTQFTTSSPQFDIQPVWSPDGTQIAWVRGALGSVDQGTFDLWRQGVDASSHPTGAAVNITSGFLEPQTEHSQPTWRVVPGANSTPTTYDVAADFSVTNGNPNGAWSYGWSDTLASPVHLYSNGAVAPDGNQTWTDPNNITLGAPVDENNSSGNQQGLLPPHSAGFHPGPNGQFSHYVWTAPVGGTFSIAATFTPDDSGGTDVHILNNGVSLFSGSVTSGNPQSFSGTVTVVVGDKIDFAVGDGGNGFFSDTTGISAVITSTSPTPSPTSTPTPSATPFAATLTFDGRLRDRVSNQNGAAGLNADGDPDGTFTVTLPPATAAKLMTGLVLTGPNGDVWDTLPNTPAWTVGVSRSLDGGAATLENSSGDGSLNAVPVGNTGVFKLFAAAAIPDVFTQGSSFTATVTFSDASTASGSVTLNKTAAVDLAIANLSTNPTPSATEGQAITYQVRVVNNGTELATGVKLTHPFVAYEVYESGGVSNNSGGIGSCTPDAAKVICTAINLGPGEDATFAVIVHFRKASDPSAGHAGFTASSIQTDASVNDNTGQITVSLGTLPRPSNDDIANAVTIIDDKGTTTGNNSGGTRQSDLNINGVHKVEPNHADLFGDSSVWYKWIAPSDGPVDFFTTTSKFNTLLGVYAIDNGYFNTVASNDDAAPGVTWSKVHFDAVAHKTYYLAVDGFLGAAGDLSLGWNHSPVQAGPAPATITGICSGDKPNCDPQHNPADYAAVCTSDSDPSLLCQQYVDAGGFTVVTVKGTNFTTNSQVIIRGDVLKGFDNNGNAVNGSTTFVNSTTLTAHIPPNPPLKIADLASVQVLTFLSAATAAAARDAATIEDIPPGLYSLGANIALLNVIELKNATIPVGHSQTVCGNVPGLNKLGEETCLFLTNLTDAPSRTVSPTWFRIVAYCDALKLTNEQCYKYGDGQAGLNQLMNAAFAINPQQAFQGGSITVQQKFPIPTGADLAHLGALVIAQGGGNVIAQGGGNVIAAGGGNIIAAGAGNVIAQGGGNVIAAGAGNVIAQGGGNIIAAGAGNIIAAGAGNRAHPEDAPFVNPGIAPPVLSAADLQSGSKGWFVASSTGGNASQVDITTNLDGTMTGTITITFDSTSSPRVQDLQGLIFTVVANPAVVKFESNNVTVNEADGRASVTLTRTGDTTSTLTVSYATSDGTATVKTDYMPVFGSVTFNPGETQKLVTIPLIDNGYGPGSGALRSFNLTIGNAVGGAIQMPNMATIVISNNDAANLVVNPLDNSDARFFVRQHYLDFLTREPDLSGQDFWANNISSCGSDAQCLEVKRINTSAAFFLSIEFQEEGYLAERTYKAAFGDATGSSSLSGAHTMPVPIIRFNQFLADAQEVGQGVIVNQGNWQQLLNDNKNAYLLDFVQRPGFVNAYPLSLTPAEFVNKLFTNVGVTPSAAEMSTALSRFGGAADSSDVAGRAMALRDVAENPTLIQQEKNRAFVLMQYFGYLRRNANEGPDTDYTGYDFWLRKLNQFNGNSVDAEMVKAFISSGEYRQRFGL